MFVVFNSNFGFAVRKLTSSSFVFANEEVCAFDSLPANAVVGYLAANRSVSALAKRTILWLAGSSGSTGAMLAASGSTAVIRAIQSLSSSSAKSCLLYTSDAADEED